MKPKCKLQLKIFRVSCGAIVLLLHCTNAYFAAAQSEATELIESCISSREKVRYIDCATSITERSSLNDDWQILMEGHCWSDVERLRHRFDFARSFNGVLEPRSISGFSCEFKNLFSIYTVGSGTRPTLVFSKEKNGNALLLNPRNAGLTTSDSSLLMSMTGISIVQETFLNILSGATVSSSPNFSIPESVSAFDSSSDLRFLNYASEARGVCATAVIDLSRGPSLLWGRLKVGPNENNFTEEVEVKVERRGQHWLPTMVDYFSARGSEEESVRRYRFTDINLKPPAKETFTTISSMGIANGTLVLGAPGFELGGHEWRDNKIQQLELRLTSDLTEKNARKSVLWMMVANAILIGACVAFIYLRRKRSG